VGHVAFEPPLQMVQLRIHKPDGWGAPADAGSSGRKSDCLQVH
jgi:hypothetical protein